MSGWQPGGLTNDQGDYFVADLTPGQYYLNACASCNQLNYTDEWYNAAGSTTDCSNAQALTVTTNEVFNGIDFQLDAVKSGSVCGQVMGPDGPVNNLHIQAYGFPCDWNNPIGGTITDEGGNYNIDYLPAGDAFIFASPIVTHLNYIEAWYDGMGGIHDCEGAVAVNVTAGQAQSGIDFYLARGPQYGRWGDVTVYDGEILVEFDVLPCYRNNLISAIVTLPSGGQEACDLGSKLLWQSECRFLEAWMHSLGTVDASHYGEYTLTLTFDDSHVEAHTLTLPEASVQEVDAINLVIHSNGDADLSWNRQNPTGDQYLSLIHI